MSIAAPASRTEIGVVYFAGMVQGLALVTFPAASAIFTGKDGFGLNSTRYGAMFVPQVSMAVLASALASHLARRWGLRRVLLLGIAGDIVSMALLALSRLLLAAPDSALSCCWLPPARWLWASARPSWRSIPMPKHSSRDGPTMRFSRSMRCSAWAPRWRRCWSQSSPAWVHGGFCPSWWRLSWR